MVNQSQAKIILVDDFSSDNTGTIGLRACKGQCTLVRPPSHGALGATRGFGLSQVTSKYTILLDADDAFLEGRIERAVHQLEGANAQVWADGIRLTDGVTGAHLKDIPIPAFIRSQPTPYRLFERNHLPGVGQVAFDTLAAQRIGYDPNLHGPEDIDLVLALIASGARFAYDDSIGYEMFTYPNSVSRNLDNQLSMYARVLRKFPLDYIKDIYLQYGSDKTTALWACISVAMYCGDYLRALSSLDELESSHPVPFADYVHEPDGPSPFPEEWRRYFVKGTALLLLGQGPAAAETLTLACKCIEKPEAFNNRGVALRLQGLELDALGSFRRALELNREFLDAKRNLGTAASQRITRLPLRALANRSSYS